MRNDFKETVTEQEVETPRSANLMGKQVQGDDRNEQKGKNGNGHSKLKNLHDYDFKINKESTLRFAPFVLYVCFWIILYIANHDYGEKVLSKIDKTNKEIKNLKADFYTLNAELSNKSIESQVSKMAEPLGLKQLTVPPQRLKLIRNQP